MSMIPNAARASYGDLPDGWRLERLKFFSTVRNSNVDKVITADEASVRLCNYTDVYNNDRITRDMAFMEGTASNAEINQFQLKAGQVLLTKDSESWLDIGIPALVSEDMPDVVCGYHLAVIDSGAELDGGYLAWLCRADPLNDQFKLGSNGVTRFGLGQYPLKNAFVALPPFETQRRIACFLDAKTARIDALIAKKRALLERLAEKRQALITQAVTKGLDPNVPMKDSGIDWLGQIPAHWDVLPLRRIALRVATGRTPPTAEGDYFADGDVNWYTPGDFAEGAEELGDSERKITRDAVNDGVGVLFPAGVVMLVAIGATLGKVAVAVAPASANQQINAILLERGNVAHYLAYLLHGFRNEVCVMSNANTLGILNQAATKALPVLRPPSREQQAIADYLVRRDRRHAAIVQKIHQSIVLLQEQRAALITGAVTGQLEIPTDDQRGRPDERLGKLATEVA